MNLTGENYAGSEIRHSFIDDFEVFDERDLFKVITYFLMSLVGIFANGWILIKTTKKNNNPFERSSTNVHYIVFHLTIADTITCFITLPMETIWKIYIGWYGGNILCKGLMMVRTGGYILSSNLLVVLSIDRYISISRPFSSLNSVKQRQRARMMVIAAWFLTILTSSPQAVIFRVIKHESKEFYQCTTLHFFDNLATEERYQIGTETVSLLGPLTPEQWANLYHTFFNFQVFFGPAIALIVSYTRIYFVLRSNAADLLRRNVEGSYNISKQRMFKALKMSIVHCAFFVLSWTPYTVMATWDTIDSTSAKAVPPIVQDILYFTAVLNSCINPFIYGLYYHSEHVPQNRVSSNILTRDCENNRLTTTTV